MNTTNIIVKNGDRMMTQARVLEEGIELTFADSRQGVIPFADIPEIGEYANLTSIELPNPYAVTLHNLDGETFEIPWDFARRYCDPSYQPRVEEVSTSGKQIFGARVRGLRAAAGLTQEKRSAVTMAWSFNRSPDFLPRFPMAWDTDLKHGRLQIKLLKP